MQLQDMEIQLWEYIDGQCNPVDSEHISIMINQDPIWKAKYNELLAFHKDVKQVETGQPSLRFTQNVLDAVADLRVAKRSDKYLNHWVIKGIAAFFAIVIIGLLGYTFASTDWQTGAASNVGYSKFWSEKAVSIFIIINIVLSLILLDSFLRKQRQRQSNTGQ